MKEPFIKNVNSFKTEEDAINYYYNYYKEYGYPNYNKEDYDPFKEFDNVKSVSDSKIIKDKNLQQMMNGCGYLWSFFPHWIDVATATSPSIRECWNNDKLLLELITKLIPWVKKHDKGIWSTNRVRQCAKVYCAKSSVSNFRPTVAKYIYNTYGNNGKVYDPCGGWGGRLFGFLTSNCIEYECCEPSTKTYEGLCTLKDTYKFINKKVSIYCEGAEVHKVKENYFDLVFTSPPYFNTEKYSEEETQSWVKYPTYEEWENGFLRSILQNSYNCVKNNSYVIINIANTNSAPTLEEDTVKIAEEIGLKHIDTLRLILSSIAGKGNKYEPVFIFKK